MQPLPDITVLDFLEWISQYHPNALLLDEDTATKYAREYLDEYLEEPYHCSDYKQCKKTFRRHVNAIIDSNIFDKKIKQIWETNCKYPEHNCSMCNYGRCMWEINYLLRDLLHDSIEHDNRRNCPSPKKNYTVENINAQHLVTSLYFYFDRPNATANPHLMQYMQGYLGDDLSSIIDFINWLKASDKNYNIYKMPKIIFEDIIRTYEESRKLKLSKKTRRAIIKGFKSKNNIYRWFNKLFSKIEHSDLQYIIERYYYDKAKFKCTILPVNGESDLDSFIHEHWSNLDQASGDFLDIFYSTNELKDTGYAILDKIKDLQVYANELPCLVIWQDNISTAKTISISELSNINLFRLMSEIITCIQKNMNLEQICIEAQSKYAELMKNQKEDQKMVQKIEQNIYGTNYGAVTGINNGTINNATPFNNNNIHSDIQQAKVEIAKIDNIDSTIKDNLYILLDEAETSISKNDDALKNECVSKFKGFMLGLGKSASSILGILGSIASIASFFGIGVK